MKDNTCATYRCNERVGKFRYLPLAFLQQLKLINKLDGIVLGALSKDFGKLEEHTKVNDINLSLTGVIRYVN